MPRSAYTLNDLALNALLACSGQEFRALLAAFEQLALDETHRGTMAGVDPMGVALHTFRVGRFKITYYPRRAEMPPMIVEVTRF